MKIFIAVLIVSFSVLGQDAESLPVAAGVVENPSFLDSISIYLLVALGISEALALLPALKSNSILSLVINILKKIAGKKDK